MLRSGLILLATSTVGVTLRSMEVMYVSGPAFKLICILALGTSVACFLGTYCCTEFGHSRSHAHR